MKINVKLSNINCKPLVSDIGDWIDLRFNKLVKMNGDDFLVELGEIYYHKGDIIKVDLGVAMELPEGYEAIIAPRSSTFKNYGLMLTNSIGVIDNSYSGNDDIWKAEFIALKNGILKRYDRILQFRIQKNQPKVELIEVEELIGENRGGYGSTGVK